MTNKTSITVGIAAYNAENNITNLINSLLSQKEHDFVITKIIVHSDCSTDNTLQIVKKNKSKKIQLIDSGKKIGFAGSVVNILKNSTSDIVVLLNDDIKIDKSDFIFHIIKTFNENKKIGLVSGNIQPLNPKTFIEESLISSIKVYNQMRSKINKGNNHFACDGKILALSKSFKNSIKFPTNLNLLGNVDAYLYFLCIKNGFNFRFAKNAIAFYRSPSNLGDYIKWTSRNNSNYSLLKKQFGTIVEKDFKKPAFWYYYYSLKETILNPLGSIFIFLTSSYIKLNTKSLVQWNNPTWEVIKTTKNLT